ncbi:MAG: aminodeoxychorismate synthase component I [Acidobacteria bacterium]|nr:aminodeoxychorismate synthase component I [Acidobacteriota bacterium]
MAFDRVYEVVSAHSLSGVRQALDAAEEATREGRWAVGFVSYDAAPAFDSVLAAHPLDGFPLAWFAICEPPAEVTTVELPPAANFEVGSLRPSLTAVEHASGVRRIQDWIARGDTYQVNFTHRLEGKIAGDPWGLFLELWRNQPSSCAAWIDTGTHALCSASPELFFSLEESLLVSRPMKGTIARGRTTAEDRQRSGQLATSAKDRAENVMIVDMIRNDLARVARPGTVRTTSLFDVERYPSVFQLTSTVEARTEAGVGEIFAALFPCASITGAPKVRTMELIRELEPTARSIYTGAIGWLAPDRRARFNVAIRTAAVDRASGRLTYGTGGGILWDSDPQAEHDECLDKAKILTAPRPSFSLLETLLWRPDEGYRLLRRHLDRLLDSADYFSIPVDRTEIEHQLGQAGADWLEPQRVRLLVDHNGRARLSSHSFTPVTEPRRLALAGRAVDSADPFLYHKTTHRAVYERALLERSQFDDVVLWNERGELTETTIANLVLEVGGERFTPPLSSGLLAGTLRADLLARGEIRERVLHKPDLTACSAVHLINSVQGWMRAELDEPE